MKAVVSPAGMFIVGQMACAMGKSPCGIHENYIGRIDSMSEDGTKVTLKAYDAETVEVLASTLKQAVHYDVDQSKYILVGDSASVVALDHPRLGVGVVYTTSVLKHNKFSGFFETRNTVYMANKVDFGAFGIQTSPYLK